MRQFRLVHIGVAAGMAAAAVTSLGLVRAVNATGGGSSSVFVPITPCRLVDTRTGPNNVGTRSTPIGSGEAAVFAVWGPNGNCTIPNIATGIATNTTAVNATAGSYLTVYPADAVPRPKASNLNFTAGSAPTPNQVTVGLSASGAIGVYNLTGTVDVIIDIVGYYEPTSAGPPGPKGDPGDPGPRPAHILWVAPSGGDFTSVRSALASITDNDATHLYLIKVAPGTYTETGGIDLKPYVDLQGSGPRVTVVTCACGSTTTPRTDGSSATLRIPSIASHVEDLSITNTGGAVYSTGVWTAADGSGDQDALMVPLLRDVNITLTGEHGNYGFWARFGSTRIEDVRIYIDHGDGERLGLVTVETAFVSSTNLDIYMGQDGTAALIDGIWNEGDVRLQNSRVFENAFHSIGSIEVLNSLFENFNADLNVHCVGAYGGNFLALGPHC